MMAESNSGSQESLPLSQETFKQLFSLLDGPFGHLMDDDTSPVSPDAPLINDMNKIQVPMPVVNSFEQAAFPYQYTGYENLVEQRRNVSSLPASENWPGDFNFSVFFNHQKATKGASWIYSEERNKLYVSKEVLCPINFQTNSSMLEDVYIRATPLFSSSNFASENVKRCVNHSLDDINREIFEAEHFIRCDSSRSYYEIDSDTEHRSVIVPYENPPAGQEYTCYLYKFMCFNSCSGGPNRRALMVVFTLERRGCVIGRQKIDLKVCACPVRDYKIDHKPDHTMSCTKRPSTGLSVEDLMLPPKKVKQENKPYCIETYNKKCYKFLRKMEKLFILYNTVKCHPSWRQMLALSSQSSSEESDIGKMN